MEERQRHFVLVHGACHGAWCWYKVATLLKSAGHKVTALDMAASGVHPKQADDIHSFSEYMEPLMEFMMSLLPEERVILVGHSMGGFSISAAMERFPEKISAGVFATAFMPGPELSHTTLNEEYARQVDSYMDTRHIFADGPNNPPTSILFGPKFMENQVYQLSPTEDLILATLSIRPLPLRGYAGTQKVVVTKEKYGSVPRIYIVCDQDKIINEDLQRWMIKNSPTDEVKVIADSDHMVMFSKPQELCSCLQEIAKKYL
ncbi:hypothetical protein GH714_031692 [Hevea brasiliensis]|uniref:(S)-hydroxynitrile lyase n=1 Tax=Hevea brasiliensis TaxID=3981 RepID=A0A6A6L2J4_HEVBR|nr:hypothetical protein GH714_031692 [Hevea brasiliensis]